jgi:hypothetical protein
MRVLRSAFSISFLFLPVIVGCASAPSSSPAAGSVESRSYQGPPTTAAITPGDLKTRLYIFADDSMRGRAAGTADNLRGAAYIARELERLGLEPAGDNGTYFQDVPLSSRTVAKDAGLTINGRTFRIVTDFVPRDNGRGMRSIDGATAIYGGMWGDSSTLISAEAAAGKFVLLTIPSNAGSTVNRSAVNHRFAAAAGIGIVSVDRMTRENRLSLVGESVGAQTDASASPNAVPSFFYVSDQLASALFSGSALTSLKPGAAGGVVHGEAGYQPGKPFPGRNVVAILRGSDPKLRGQYVAFGAHNDHEPVLPFAVDHDSLRAFNTVASPEGAETGVSQATPEQWVRIRAIRDSLRALRPPRRDSVMNGADDDGTGSMALLEIAEAFAKSGTRPRRSLLFVWHTGEEIGLVGSEYFTDHPTVPRDSIVTQLNIDMIGRGGSNDAVHMDASGRPIFGNPNFVEVIGSRKLSTELGDIIDDVNRARPDPLSFSKVFDTPGDPNQMYCRSDHYNYARYGIPITFFFTSVHRDYHQPTDEPQYIDYNHYARIVNLVHDAAERVANLDHRPVVDKPKPDPKGSCVA